VIKAKSTDVRHSEPETVASAIERQNVPPMPASHGVGVQTAATIGYEHWTDPYTGRPVSGVYTGGSVTVDQNRRDQGPLPDPKPGGTPEDRRLLATQLRTRSIPEGPVNHPVAGYIFFRKSDIKTESGDNYQLQYLADDEATSTTHAVILAVPRRAR
jgi:hypothetical protein